MRDDKQEMRDNHHQGYKCCLSGVSSWVSGLGTAGSSWVSRRAGLGFQVLVVGGHTQVSL